MKFLHLADLHLGRSFHERSLLEDQKLILAQILDLYADDDYGAVVIAGDVYDRSIPTPEAVSLLGDFLATLRSRFPTRPVLMIPGNHDSAERLAYADTLLRELDIHIVSDPSLSTRPVMVEKDGEKCAFFLLPFLQAGALLGEGGSEGDREDGESGQQVQEELRERPLRSQAELAAAAAKLLDEERRAAVEGGATATILVAHLFGAGGKASESERLFVGTAEKVDLSPFENFDYLALGHLHRAQRVANNAWYAGSPLAYSFDEAGADKCVLSVGVGAHGLSTAEDGQEHDLFSTSEMGGAQVQRLPLKPLRRVTRLSGPFVHFYQGSGYEAYRNDYLEISLTDGAIVESPQALLRPRFPHLLSIRQDWGGKGVAAQEHRVARRGGGENITEDFAAFMMDLYGHRDEEKERLFSRYAKEAESDATR